MPVGSSTTFTADAINTVTPDDIVIEFGPRVPDHVASQKNPKAAFIVVSEEFLSRAEFTFKSVLAESLAGVIDGGNRPSFRQATGNRGNLLVGPLVISDGFGSGEPSRWSSTAR